MDKLCWLELSYNTKGAVCVFVSKTTIELKLILVFTVFHEALLRLRVCIHPTGRV